MGHTGCFGYGSCACTVIATLEELVLSGLKYQALSVRSLLVFAFDRINNVV